MTILLALVAVVSGLRDFIDEHGRIVLRRNCEKPLLQDGRLEMRALRLDCEAKEEEKQQDGSRILGLLHHARAVWANEVTVVLAMGLMVLDDPVWYLPFAADRARSWRFGLVYVSLMQSPVLVAWGLVALVGALGKSVPAVPFPLLMKVASATALAMYTLFQYWEWRKLCEASASETSEPPVDGADNPNEAQVRLEGEQRKVEARTYRQLVTITCLNNLNNISIFVSMLLALTSTVVELAVATLIASCMVVVVSMVVGSMPVVIDFLERMPLWVVLLLVVVWSFGGATKDVFHMMVDTKGVDLKPI